MNEGAYVGKYLSGAPRTYVPPGWDRWVSFVGEPAFYGCRLNVDGAVRHPKGFRRNSTDVFNRESLEFISRPRGGPFFLVLAPYAPHNPATPLRAMATPSGTRPSYRDGLKKGFAPAERKARICRPRV